MMTSTRTLLLASLAFPSALAVSLADFSPRATNLPSACETLYTADISGCQASDFETKKCSLSCINTLNALVSPVTKACQGVTGSSVIAAMMVGQATVHLCPNANSYSGGGAPAAGVTPTASSSPSKSTTTSNAPASSTSSSPSATSSSSSTDSSAQSTTLVVSTSIVIPQASSVGSSIMYDSSAPPSSAAATQTKVPASQGGTLFSNQPGMTGVGATLKVSSTLLLAAAGGAALLLVAGIS